MIKSGKKIKKKGRGGDTLYLSIDEGKKKNHFVEIPRSRMNLVGGPSIRENGDRGHKKRKKKREKRAWGTFVKA